MITPPRFEQRNAQPYAAIRVQVPIPFGDLLPPLWREVATWLAGKGQQPAGAPFIRYLSTDMARTLDIEVGFPAPVVLPADGRVHTGVISPGPYAVTEYHGRYDGLVAATAAFLGWARNNNVTWQKGDRDGVEWWEGRYEHYITDPNEQPDASQWITELAFLTAEIPGELDKPFVSTASLTIQAPAARVWQALTDPALIKQYLFGTEVSSDWQVGSPITYRGVWQGKPYEDKGVILAIEPGRRLVSTFWSALEGKPDRPENYKKVRYELAAEGDVTHVTISNDNNASLDDADHSSQNWQMVLGGLKKVVEGQMVSA